MISDVSDRDVFARSAATDRTVRRFALVTLVLPAIVVALALTVQLLALPYVPPRIPVHWNGAGGTDGWSSPGLPLVLTLVLGMGFPAVIGLSGLPSLRRGERSPAFRVFGAQALGISVMQTVVATTLMFNGLGGAAASETRMWVALIAGLAVGVAAAVLGWRLQPGDVGAMARSVAPIELAPSERAVWMRTISLPGPALVVISAVIVLVGLRALRGWMVGDTALAWIPTAAVVLLIGVLVTTTAFRVRVDASGLSVRSVLGVPRFRMPIDDVGAVAVVDARSLGMFGSWGIRARPGRRTIVMRPTTGIQVTRRSGGRFFVTVDDATTGAALLEALAERAAGADSGPAEGEKGGELRHG